MTWRSLLRLFIVVTLSNATVLFFSGCGTTSTRALPAYERPMAKTDFQTVRTTAYTHTESDHLEYTNHNALGGELHAAGPPIRRAENTRITVAYEQSDYQQVSYSSGPQPFSMETDAPRSRAARAQSVTVKTVRGRKVITRKSQPPKIGSAAADWSRWPVGTVFRLLSTGQVYKIDDYGWALAGRNTIDLYMPTRSAMNSWGAREEGIQILRWGNPNESLRLLQAHQSYRHIRRMVLELQGQDAAAASLE
jgi:3D (Asp-Asp-Asp) domain-containing protein